MKVEIFNLKTKEIKDGCLERIGTVPFGKGWTVLIQTEKNKRSNDQNSLYWLWLSYLVISGIGGEWDKNEWHNHFKSKFLRQLLTEQDKEWVEHYKLADKVYSNSEFKAEAKKLILKTVSTTDLNVKFMTEYLKLIDFFAVESGVILPIKDEYTNLNIRE